MGSEKSTFEFLKKWLRAAAWSLFLWASNLTQEEYWREIALQEVAMFPERYWDLLRLSPGDVDDVPVDEDNYQDE